MEDIPKGGIWRYMQQVFEILQATEADTLTQMRKNWLKNAKIFMATYKNMDEETKNMMTKTMEALFVIIKNNMIEKLKPTERKRRE